MNIFDLAYLRDAPPVGVALLHIVAILIFAWLLLRISRKLIYTFRARMGARAATAENIRRIDTLAHVSRYVVRSLITLIASMMILSELGVSIAPILGAAGVAGIAVGFGAQSLIKDYFNGFFILLENQIHEGDVVEVSSKTGVVEKVTLRYILLRDFEGSVHFIPNGLITTVTNKSRGYAYAVIDVNIAYRESIDEAFDVMRKVGSEMRASVEYAAKMIEDIDIAGVQDWADSAVVLRCRFKVIPLEQWGVRREFLRRLKEAFDARGIEIPYPHVTMYVGQDKSGIPSALRVLKTKDDS
ncbi:Small conductance mechanosensitive channel [Candidatus Nitrotoga sp. HW29]|uniref:mechanosensitive ion channel family protein n=1 Tax=Candidatus Nitrotoga sp. HW29 TaxID=2886963 RepID=UPI001EF3B2C6|nr:mechanosensitive ion channel family protein [Candidatus Nitrotoga sp. HW29]CAH1905104.1 Small conductance mechanosensitive channel [Candidatus Nitrotoga sp. HW29]